MTKREFLDIVFALAPTEANAIMDAFDEYVNSNEPHEIGYDGCANALLKMWMDNVLTDGEYYRIADKLNKKWGKREVAK